MHRSVYLSIDLFTRLSIDLAIKSHCTYPLLCFKNRCLQELPRWPTVARSVSETASDAKRRRYTDGSEKTPSFQRSNDNTGNNKVTCCRLGSAATKDTRSIESCASKSALRPSVFNTFDFEMCFAPQRRALFQHLNFQKCAEPSVFNTFYFQMFFAPQRRALFRHLNFQNLSETLSF